MFCSAPDAATTPDIAAAALGSDTLVPLVVNLGSPDVKASKDDDLQLIEHEQIDGDCAHQFSDQERIDWRHQHTFNRHSAYDDEIGD
jgi:hypothetical protein